jgi:hypothetical protein
MRWLAEAGGKATSVAALAFTGGPTIATGAPGLVGVRFTGSGTTHVMLLNLSSTPVKVPVGGPVPAGTYQQVSARSDGHHAHGGRAGSDSRAGERYAHAARILDQQDLID